MSFDDSNFPSLPVLWTTVAVDEAYEAVTVRHKIQTKSYLESGPLAVVDQGASLIGGYSNDLSRAVQTDLPVVVFGDHTRAIKYIDFPFAAGADGIKVLRPCDYFEPRVFYRFLQTIRLPDKGYARHFQHLRMSRIPVPPLNEQKRIADKLDAVLARVDACRERLDRVPSILKRFRQAVLAAATSGKLTEEWRATFGRHSTTWRAAIAEQKVRLPDNYRRLSKQSFRLTPIEHSARGLPSTWALVTIGELYELGALVDFADGNHGSLYPRKHEFGAEGALFLTATQVGEKWELDLLSCPRLLPDKARQLTKGWARANDVLLTHNATVGRVALLEYAGEEVLLGTSVTFYRFNDRVVSPRFARILFSSPFFQDQLESVMKQTTRDQVPITKQVSLNFVCPPIEEQGEIVRRVEALFAYTDRLEARYTAARAQVERLTPTILAKAFRGELVSQDMNDEPASVLLERIRAVHAAVRGTASPNRRKGSGRPKTSEKAEILILTRKDVQDTHMTPNPSASSASSLCSSS